MKNLLLQRSEEAKQIYLPHLSLDCAIFGFNKNALYILLMQIKDSSSWSLPGGFLLKEEKDFEVAATRILKARTGAEKIFLNQFSVFSDINRLGNTYDSYPDDLWHKQRFITVGYYALIDYNTVKPIPDSLSQQSQWVDINNLPTMAMDHAKILETALQTLRKDLNYKPVGINLLPEEFTMIELQKLYEAILGRELNRGNFYKRIRLFDILITVGKSKKEGVHKSSIFYKFDIEKYEQATKSGFNQIW